MCDSSEAFISPEEVGGFESPPYFTHGTHPPIVLFSNK